METEVPDNANEHCPGTASEEAGKADACQGCPNQSICASAPKGPDPYIKLIGERLQGVKNIVLVLSGKGGVGKSSFSAQLARSLSEREELAVGLLDLDICGPSVPHMFGMGGESIHQTSEGMEPVYDGDLALISVGFVVKNDEAVIWRGDKKNSLIRQFLSEVTWGELDYLIVDTPPGTSDEHISVVKYLEEANVAGAVLVTTPQQVSVQDVRKMVSFCNKVSVPVLGVVENMSGFVCSNCGTETEVFFRGQGGAKRMCEDLELELLGNLPLDPQMGKACDRGEGYLDEEGEGGPSVGQRKFVGIVERVMERVEEGRARESSNEAEE